MIGGLAYVAWKLAYYGSVLPNTHFARGADRAHLDAGIAYLMGFVASYPQVMILLALGAVGLALSSSSRHRALCGYALAASLLYSAYLVRVGGDFMEYRLILQVYPLTVASALVGALALAARTVPAASLCTAAALAACLTPTRLETDHYMQSLEEMDGYLEVGTSVGRALARLPEDTVVATTLIGTVGYYSGLPIVDQWGLVDPLVSRRPPSRGFVRGHLTFAPRSHVIRRGTNLYLEHPVICPCSAPCTESVPNVFIRLDDDRCLRTWHLSQTPELTRLFCSDPEEYILHRVRCD